MKRDIENPYPTGDHCFMCGRDNPEGLRLRFCLDEERAEVSTTYVPERRFAGQGDILHGAIQTGLLDEAMGWTAVVFTGHMAVTTEMNVKFLRPVYINERPLGVTCRVSARHQRDVDLEAELADGDGVVCTTATSTYRLLSEERYMTLIRQRSK